MLFQHFVKRRAVVMILLISMIISGCQKVFPQNASAGLQITTEDVKASVYLNGELVNSTPYVDKTLKAGTYNVRLEADDASLAPYETSVTLYPETLAVLNWKFDTTVESSSGILFEMEPLGTAKAVVSIMSIPDSTIVKIDDISMGFAPIIQEDITVGSHKLLVSLPSYVEQQRNVNIVEGYKMKIHVKLAKETSRKMEVTEKNASSSASLTESDTSTVSAQSRRDALITKEASNSAIVKPYVEILSTPTGWLRVRATSSVIGEELSQIDSGEKVRYVSSENGWHEVEYDSGKTGWVSGQYSKVVE